MARKKKKHRFKNHHSSLVDHKRVGRRVLPPMRQLDGMESVPWLRDAFPDMLLICSIIADDPRATVFACARVLDTIADVLPTPGADDPAALIITGSLTSLEAVPEDKRGAVLEALEKADLYHVAVSEDFAHSLAMYPDAPGQWLLGPWRRRGIAVDWEKAQAHLKRVILACADGRTPASTGAKHVFFRAYARSGKLHLGPAIDTAKLLTRYPNGLSEHELERVDAFVRAGFLALIRVNDTRVTGRLAWAQAFWRKNWSIFPCSQPAAATPPSDSDKHDNEALYTFADQMSAQRKEIEDRFLRGAETTDPDLYSPDRYEVLTGLVARSLRLLEGAIRSPLLWTDEYGTPLLRSIIEAKIVLHWLIKRQDQALFEAFKDYGRGHLKLLALHVRDYLATMEESPPALVEYAEALGRQVNEDASEEFQDIDLSTSFAGVTIRDMAIEAGLKRDYDLVYSPASSSTHGEWTALDRYALERCTNPTHMWHRVPRRPKPLMVGEGMIEFLLTQVEEIIDYYLHHIARRARSASLTTPSYITGSDGWKSFKHRGADTKRRPALG